MNLLDFIWPRACEICMRPVDRPGRYLCSDCLNRLSLTPTRGLCQKCGRDAAGFEGEYLCQECRERRPAFDRTGSALFFEGEARSLVNHFKFREALHLKTDFVDLLEAMAMVRFNLKEIDVVSSVPLALTRRIVRGYDQCEMLGVALAKRLKKTYRKLLKRVGSPVRQSSLSEEDRRKNVIGTFALRGPFSARTVLLVDDIMTTGSTLSECAKVLKSAGAKTVYCLTLARSVRK